MLALLSLVPLASSASPVTSTSIPSNIQLEVLEPGTSREMLAQAGELLGGWSVEIAGVAVDGPRLSAIASSEDSELLRAAREDLGRPVDLDDLILLLDDVLVAGQAGRRGEDFCFTSGRLRSAGVLVHPDEVFKGKVRSYGGKESISVDRPEPPASYPPAADGDLLGPNWSARYQNPSAREPMIAALAEQRPEADYAARIEHLLQQFEAQGAEVWVTSTVRSRHRGYLMWGAFLISRAESEAQLNEVLARLEAVNVEWKLNVPIQWRHPEGWEANVEAGRQMAEAYDVVYATENGARWSKHYSGVAADFVVLDLPRSVTLTARDGASQTFDLSDPRQPRDLSLTPELIDWVEQHYGFEKLNSDYPHWDDVR
jgi:hypothetical protein